MTCFALLRHGETEWNRERRIQGRTDVPLNGRGRAQAVEAARRLSGEWSGEWSGVVTSPLARARETGSILAAALRLPLLPPVAGLIERDYGVAEGRPVDEVTKRWPAGEYPGAETVARLAARGVRCISDLADSMPGNVIVVSHGALLRATITAVTDSPAARIANGEVVVLHTSDGRWTRRAPAHAPGFPGSVARIAGNAAELGRSPRAAPVGETRTDDPAPADAGDRRPGRRLHRVHRVGGGAGAHPVPGAG